MFRDRLAYKGTEVSRIVKMYNVNYEDEEMILGYLRENKIKYECDTEIEPNRDRAALPYGITSSDLEIAFEKESEYHFFIAFLVEAKSKGEA